MNFCFSVLAAVILLGMVGIGLAWQRTLNQAFRDTLTTWAATRQLTIHKIRYVLPLMTLDPFVWRHPNDAVFKVWVQPAATTDTRVGWVAVGRDSVGAPNETITASF